MDGYVLYRHWHMLLLKVEKDGRQIHLHPALVASGSDPLQTKLPSVCVQLQNIACGTYTCHEKSTKLVRVKSGLCVEVDL